MKKPIQAPSIDHEPEQCLHAARGLLDQGLELLRRVSDESYSRPLRVAADASIGGHYRHCLDHFSCLLQGIESGRVNYDRRERDPMIESNREAAESLTTRLQQALAGLSLSQVSGSIEVCCKVDYECDRSQSVKSSVAREIMYVVAHGVHHFALIAVMARVMELPLPDEFGVAPSTLQYRRQESTPVEMSA